MKKVVDRKKAKKFNIAAMLLMYIAMVIFRLFHLADPALFDLVDADYMLRVDELSNGLFNLYGDLYNTGSLCHYLYYWYFYFFPFWILPPIVGVFLWDLLRLIMFLYIIEKIDNYIKDDMNYLLWIGITQTAFYFDQYLNNANFLIMFFLFVSYEMLLKEKKVAATIFFILGVIKINALIYLVVILVNKKINFRELIVYYVVPLLCVMLPYFIFPDYLYQWLSNLGFFYSDLPTEFSMYNLFRFIIIILWKMFQFAQFMFYGFIFALFIEERKEKWRNITIWAFLSLYLVLIGVLSIVIYFFPLF